MRFVGCSSVWRNRKLPFHIKQILVVSGFHYITLHLKLNNRDIFSLNTCDLTSRQEKRDSLLEERRGEQQQTQQSFPLTSEGPSWRDKLEGQVAASACLFGWYAASPEWRPLHHFCIFTWSFLSVALEWVRARKRQAEGHIACFR